ncbi:platelet-activating factor acetylhydrolase, isoform II-domain-containing protein [Piptocephalis cylindrospora]|uniref:1-alkyl-2-acetylglycerophosphocholine esterase n=1 Tax=Piptocephalis cylindrospora TaxID=1907219 RepID=A0A4P9Y4W6_9FUNG|nr:platelet-activating factor acetylhydrolase, isoform II-domain-containing protein [Piptocephalis cylindrospora]|eukprot:RKP13844.1 platelet-activating factor acetylhydrolase, isoform II-domain-containing protein [Piptocephalis cylindrospora]
MNPHPGNRDQEEELGPIPPPQPPPPLIPHSEGKDGKRPDYTPSRLSVFPTLPPYSGPYAVGCHDIVFTPSREEEHTEPVIFRLYYPAELPSHSERMYPRPHWLPNPFKLYSTGYGHFLKVPWYISRPLFASTLSFTRLPAHMNAPLASQLPKIHPESIMSSASPSPSPTPSTSSVVQSIRFPVMLFSHGLGGCRTTYSTFCGEMASYGFVVAALEHREGSAAVSGLQKGKDPVLYRHILTSEAEEPIRREQLEHRVREVQAVWSLLDGLNDGTHVQSRTLHPPPPSSSSKSKKNNRLTSTPMSTPFTPRDLAGRLDMSRVIMSGHSFGAATTFASMHQTPGRFVAGIAMDTWMLPLEASGLLGPEIPPPPRPVISINSQVFTRWKSNYAALSQTMAQTPEPSYLMTIRGSAHQNQSDFPTLFRWATPAGAMGWWKRRKQRRNGEEHETPVVVDPVEALRCNNRACLAFLYRVLCVDGARRVLEGKEGEGEGEGEEGAVGTILPSRINTLTWRDILGEGPIKTLEGRRCEGDPGMEVYDRQVEGARRQVESTLSLVETSLPKGEEEGEGEGEEGDGLKEDIEDAASRLPVG